MLYNIIVPEPSIFLCEICDLVTMTYNIILYPNPKSKIRK